MKTFYLILIQSFIAFTTNNFVWFALTYWAYLETRSVIATSLVGGTYLVGATVTGFWFGSIVDHNKKKIVMLFSSLTSLIFFIFGLLILLSNPESAFTSVTNPILWLFIIILLAGSITGNLYGIAIPTLVAYLVPEDRRDKTNGLFGTIMGMSFAITSIASGFILGNMGMVWVLSLSIVFTFIAVMFLLTIPLQEKNIIHTAGKPRKVDIKGTIRAIGAIPGLFALIFFTTFNNFISGVFMALMDAYGLSLVSVQVWGSLWGFLSLGFIIGGLLITKFGLGKNPLKSLFRINIVVWFVCIFFTVQPSIILLAIGSFIWMILFPFIEATEQTIIQKVVPPERLGRVFGFAHSVEQAASPLTAFLIGPIAQFIFIPFMTTGEGITLIGSWFGVGAGRGIALVFIFTGIIGLSITLLAMRLPSYKLLAKRFVQ